MIPENAAARRRRIVCLLAVGAFLAVLAGALLEPGRVLAVRDLPQFHLPLRATLARLAVHGLPEWNPWIGPGQPILSDPSYSAFYPPTWLAAVLPPAWSLSVELLLHLALAAAGAFVLARRLGTRSGVAVFAAVAWSGSGVLLSLVEAYNLFGGAAWLAWALVASHALGTAADRDARRRALLGLAAVFTMILLNGEPVTLLCAGLAAGAMAFGQVPAAAVPRRLVGVGAAALLATALAAVQLVPALVRLTESVRGPGLDWTLASGWSLPPARGLELIEPAVFGDPLRSSGGLNFGWGIHDRDYPYVISIYPGLIVLVLGATGLLRGRIRARLAWATMIALGLVLALGRHTPVYGFLFHHVPPFSSLRFPEKFVLLAGAGLVFAAVVELERLLAERETGDRTAADLPIVLAALIAAATGGAALFARAAPAAIDDFVAAHSGLAPLPRSLELARAFFRRESTLALGLALATLAVLVLLRARRPASVVVVSALTLVAAVDLAIHHRPLIQTLPASVYDPPPLARELLAAGRDRIWSSANLDPRPELILRGSDPRSGDFVARIARLDPWIGTEWGLTYVLATDYSLTFTEPLRRAVETARELFRAADWDRLYRLLGAWGVEQAVLRKGPAELAEEARSGRQPIEPARLAPSPFALPVARFAPAAEAFPDARSALAAALADEARFARKEYVVAPRGALPATLDADARVTRFDDRGREVDVAVGTHGPALLVVATTWDRFWSAWADGVRVPVLETAAGYQALPLPAGTREVRLVYRDPWVRVGAATTAATLLAIFVVVRRRKAPDAA